MIDYRVVADLFLSLVFVALLHKTVMEGAAHPVCLVRVSDTQWILTEEL